MPVPPIVTSPYDLLSDVLDLVRFRMLDTMVALSGEILTNDSVFMMTAANSGWRRFQGFLASNNDFRFTDEAVLYNIPASAQTPDRQAYITWNEYSDGYFVIQPPFAPVLPQNLIEPIKAWERPSANQAGDFIEMDNVVNGLPSNPKIPWNQFWEWRNTRFIIPGASVATDIRIRFAAYFPDFVTVGDTQWYQQQVPIMRCKDPLASFICYDLAQSRGDTDAQTFLDKAKEATLDWIGKDDPPQQVPNTPGVKRASG